MKRFLFEYEVRKAEGTQIFYVDAETLQDAWRLLKTSGGEFFANEIEVISLGKPEHLAETTLDDFGQTEPRDVVEPTPEDLKPCVDRIHRQIEDGVKQKLTDECIEKAAWALAELDGFDDPGSTIFHGTPPEPWGPIYMKYIDKAKAVLEAAGFERVQQGSTEAAARWVEARMQSYIDEHGHNDPDTGAVEFPGNGDEYVGELMEIAEGIRSLEVPINPVLDNLAAIVRRLAHSLRQAAPNHDLPKRAMDYLRKHGLQGSWFRAAAEPTVPQAPTDPSEDRVIWIVEQPFTSGSSRLKAFHTEREAREGAAYDDVGGTQVYSVPRAIYSPVETSSHAERDGKHQNDNEPFDPAAPQAADPTPEMLAAGLAELAGSTPTQASLARAWRAMTAAVQPDVQPKATQDGWCTACGCGNDRYGYAHLSSCERPETADWRPFGLTVQAALDRGDDPALLFDENSPIRDELRRLLAIQPVAPKSLMDVVEQILDAGHLDQEDLARLRAAWDRSAPTVKESLTVDQREAVPEDAAMDTQRLDWLSRAGEVSIELVIDQPHDGAFWCSTASGSGYGKTFRAAIDAAANGQP
jgi:hypothetical protein